MKIKSICVYCASSSKIDRQFFEAAKELGKLLAQDQITCICGAGHQGLMGELTESVLLHQGHIKGVIPQFMCDEGWHHPKVEDLIITPDMHTRKQVMAELSDAVIAMPGGCGTLEELLEIITWRQLGLYHNPIIILNIKKYYDPLIQMLSLAIEENFMRPDHGRMWEVAESPEEALQLLQQSQPLVIERKLAAI